MYTASESIDAANQAMQLRAVMQLQPNNFQAEAMAGGALSRGGATMGPLMSGAAGMLGLDPLSLGLKAGMGAYSSGAVGLAGAGAIGMGVMGGVAAGGLALGYAGNQMMQGAQQQMQLNQGLRQNYNFMNAQGGQGFTSNQGFQIGGALRDMSHQVGSGGEQVGFEELSRMASNMGRMGMGGKGARTVEEFKTKFKELLETTKKIAHDLGSTVEDAMKAMAAMKNSGVFRAVDQAKMSGDIRMTSLAGGLATSEVSAMGNIGSQISRSVGGLGRAGANAGINTIGQIGMATQVGALSEEDIYNATGQTGADGRQALATSQLQRSAHFLKGGRGRRFLASIAGKDGELNEDSVNEWMSGGNMSTGRTMQMAHQNLSGVGRANFIRNEGRLRGAALEKFGGLAQSMAYQQWLGSRGHDVNDMNDRGMLAFQRFSGMGRDEAEVAIKQIQALPETMREMRETTRGAGRADALQRQRSTTGIEGLKRKVDHMKHEVNTAFESAGAKVLAGAQEKLEGWFNEMQGVYVSTATEGASELLSHLEHGTGAGGGARDFRRMVGSAGGAGPSSLQFANKQASDLLMAARQGSTDPSVAKYAGANPDSIKMATLAAMGKQGDAAVSAFASALDPAGQKMFNSANRLDQAGMMQQMQQGGGVASGSQIATLLAKQQRDADMGGGARTEAGYQRNLGNLALGRDRKSVESSENAGHWGAGGAAILASVTFGASSALGDLAEGFGFKNGLGLRGMGRNTGLLRGEDDEYTRAAGAMFQDKKYLGVMSDMFEGSDSEQKSARSAVLDEVTSIRQAAKDGKMGTSDRAKVDMLSAASIASRSDVGALLDRYNKGEKVDLSSAIKDFRTISNSTGSDEDIIGRLQGARSGGKAAVEEQHRVNYQKMYDQAREEQNSLRESTQGMGRATMEKDENGRTTGKLKATGQAKTNAELVAQDVLNRQLNVDMTGPGGLAKFVESRQTSNEDIASLSAADRKSIARSHAGDAAGDTAAVSLAQEARFKGSRKRGGGTDEGAVLDMAGVSLSKNEKASLSKMSADERNAFLAKRLDLNEDQKKDFQITLSQNNSGKKAADLATIMGSDAFKDSKAGKALAERREGQRDPQEKLLEKIQTAADKQNKFLEALVLSSKDAAAKLGEINNKAAKDAEAPKP